MTDGRLAEVPRTDGGTDIARTAARRRERVREIISSEVDKLNPTDDARHPLELIIESSIRASETDGVLTLTVVDQRGQPRMIEKGGRSVPFGLHDLLEELRQSHPILFRKPTTPETASDATAQPQPAAEPSSPAEPPKRDWLALERGGPPPDTSAASPHPVERALGGLRKGPERIRSWTRGALQKFTNAVPEGSVTEGPAPRADAPPASSEIVPPLVEDARTGSVPRGAGLAVAGLVLAALLGIGGYALFGRNDAPPQQASVGDPATTGAVAAPQNMGAPPATPASTSNQTLRGVPDVVDTATLSLKGEVVRLFGVEWAPGGGKPDDLTRYLAGREVECQAAGATDTYRCHVGGQDLSRVVLFNGGGRPTAEATPDLKAAADKAREAKVGVWSQQTP